MSGLAAITPLAASIEDVSRATGLLVAVAGDISDVRYLVIPGDPPSKARPRFARGGRTYTPAESRAAEKRTSGFLRQFFAEPMTGNVAIACVFYRPNRQRIDADNLLKHVCDAANGIVWIDDSQVTAIVGILEHDAEHPRTLIAVSPHESTMTRGTDDLLYCKVCQAPFPRPRTSRTTCSRECAAKARGFTLLTEPVPCAHCGELFKRTTSSQKMCSPDCRYAHLRARNKASARALSNCSDCGIQLAHHRGGRCRSCWRMAVAT